MSAFSLTDAAFEGFRLTREQPRLVGAWALLYGVMGLVTAVVMVWTIGPQFALLQDVAHNMAPTDTTEAMRRLHIVAPFLAIIFPLVLGFWSVLTCAVYRAILKPEERGFGRLRLGGDELRMAGLTILIWLLVLLTIVVSGIFVGVGAVLTSGGGLIGGIVGNLVGLASLALTVFVWVRLSLAGPVTFLTGEIHLFRSWSLTRGHFWRLAGAYAMAAGLAAVVWLLAQVIFMAIAGVFVILSGHPLSDMTKVFKTDTTSLAAYFTPIQIFYQAFWSVLQVVLYAVLLSPAAVIYATLTGRPFTYKA